MKKKTISPHLSIYKLQMSSLSSILHRITGIALFIGSLMILWFFIAFVFSEFSSCYMKILSSSWGKVFFILFYMSSIYHFAASFRHLLWEELIFIEKKYIISSSIFLFAITIIVTSLFLFYIISS